jgi:hypothetical protein
MPGILAPQEAEIKRIEVQSQPRQTVHKTPSRKHPSHKKRALPTYLVPKKKGTSRAGWHTPGNTSYARSRHGRVMHGSSPVQAKKKKS